jgi:hypothetical protein
LTLGVQGGRVILHVKNWNSFQHYKNRNPIWIKLHKSLLDNYEFQCLPVASKALAPMLWLLASEYVDGVIDASAEKIAFRLHMTADELKDALIPLIEKDFVIQEQLASNPLAVVERVAIPEKRREEIEREKETEPRIIFQIATAHPKLAHLRERVGNPLFSGWGNP